jgi:hypothetical protein
LKRFCDGRGLKQAIGRSTPEKDLSVWQSGTSLKIVHKACANLVGQGQEQVISAFLLGDANQASPPLYIIKGQRYDFT